MTSTPDTVSSNPGRLMWWGVAGAALLMIAGGGAFTYASMNRGAAGGADAVTVTLKDGRCEPNALSVPAGRSTFRIVNETSRAVEWEILDGVMVLEERENIAPGITQTLGARLRAGEYAITCGLLSNPRGTLTVTPSAGPGETERPALVAFIGPLAEYQVFLAMQANELVKSATALDAAVQAGDLDEARRLYPAARLPYLRLEPVASRFADLDNSIDPVAAYLEKREADPAFTGFHRIEYALFSQNDAGAAASFSAKLVADAGALKDRLRNTRLGPDDMANGALRTLAMFADTRMPSGENLYAKTDLSDFEGAMAGVAKVATLLKPVAVQTAPNETAEVEKRLAALQADIAARKGPDGAYPPYDQVDAATRTKLADEARALGDAIRRMSDAVGLGQGGAA
ncbi:iron uptake system protein EfeO [Aureimonas leprariae]|uniref:Iron uptake system protein EfeO n=1 Tax=Plantimonas leprariae TaxID=2615207 RepID=A0A7V7PMX3_9HYPH|nr:iron uptake system protein EfeO [Aureimonas leprariae]KAB0678816.1 iron uptake system protein EfeO [Aureimonas leprariae]